VAVAAVAAKERFVKARRGPPHESP